MPITSTTVRLADADWGERQRARKSIIPSPVLAAVATKPTLTTSFQLVSDTFDVGNNPSVGGNILWLYSGGATLTVRFKVSLDNATLDRFKYAPSIGSPTTGTSAVDIIELTYAKATWDDGVDTADCPFELLVSRWRYFQIWVKSSNASGSVTGYVGAGTQG